MARATRPDTNSEGPDKGPKHSIHPKLISRRSMLQEKSASIRDLEELENVVKSSQSDGLFAGIWGKLFGIVAILDLLATVLPPILRKKEAAEIELALEEAERQRLLPKFLTFWKKDPRGILDVQQCVDGIKCLYERGVRWLSRNHLHLSWFFCILWILDSANKAYLACDAATKALDESTSPESKPKNKSKVKEESISKARTEVNPTLVFAKLFLLRLSLLPIGFYMLRLVDHYAILTLNENHFVGQNQIIDSDDFTATDSSNMSNEVEGNFYFDGTQRYCLLYVIILSIKSMISHFLLNQIASLKGFFAKKVAPRLLRFAFLNPRLFKKRIDSVLRFLRWVKYLIPLFQKSEKLIKTSLKIFKVYKQRRQAAIAKKIRKIKWKTLSEDERRKKAAVRLQANFRAKKAKASAEKLRKGRLLMMSLLNKKKTKAVLKLQSVLKLRALQARRNLEDKKDELQRLTKSVTPMKASILKVSLKPSIKSNDQNKIAELQTELKSVVKKQKALKMLMRPNTRFIIKWKLLFMVCVGIEMGQKAFEPRLMKYVNEKTGQPFSLQLTMETAFVPESIHDWPLCTTVEEVESSWLKRRLNSSKTMGDEVIVSEFPWYCDSPYTTLHSVYSHLIRFFISMCVNFMSTILFLDVFVNFFTGEYDESGTLVPKKIFTRWCFPGLGFNILVNPKLKDVNGFVRLVLNGPGPARSYKWLVAFINPLFVIIVSYLQWNFWMTFVSSENKQNVR